ncbi:hypothetical protein OROMI_010469 [Orobanche minor]
MKKNNDETGQKLDRKTVERNRRIHTKDLCFKLSSVIPPRYLKTSRDRLSQPDQLDQATSYIKEIIKRIDELNRTKAEILRSLGRSGTAAGKRDQVTGSERPVVELRDLGSSMEVVIISSLDKECMLFQLIGILEGEGAQVVSANFSSLGDNVFHTIHAQVRICRVGVETTRVLERIKELIN